MNKKTKTVGSLIVIFILISIVVGYFLTRNTITEKSHINTLVVDKGKDAHGCVGRTWCESKNRCLRTADEVCEIGIEQKIASQLAEKYDKTIYEVKITITKQNEGFAGGSVVVNKSTDSEGGLFLARKLNGVWEVVFDGNGALDCNKMRQDYKFTDDFLVPNFCD